LTVTLQFMLSGDYFRDLRPQVAELLAAGVGVLVYNGDDDFMVDWLGSKLWMGAFHWPYHEEWMAAKDEGFFVDGQKRGVVRTAHGLTFLQIYNAGHLVPMDQPKTALAMVREFLSASSPWRASSGSPSLLADASPSGSPVAEAPLLVLIALLAAFVSAGFLIGTRVTARHLRCTEERPYLLLA